MYLCTRDMVCVWLVEVSSHTRARTHTHTHIPAKKTEGSNRVMEGVRWAASLSFFSASLSFNIRVFKGLSRAARVLLNMGDTDKKWDCGAEQRESGCECDFARGKFFRCRNKGIKRVSQDFCPDQG